ncbi:MAG: hypothetical protein HQ515_18155 [Phycisphaeraceae bacterium]|nr:hypothetical protein [Phycisphaeraceae bacterium]
MTRLKKATLVCVTLVLTLNLQAQNHTPPDEIDFVRQGVRRLIFDADQAIPLASLIPAEIIGLDTMHPVHVYTAHKPDVSIKQDVLVINSQNEAEASLWFGGFNPFATYSLDLASCQGAGAVGFEFSDRHKRERLIVTVSFKDNQLTDARLRIFKDGQAVRDTSILTASLEGQSLPGKIILQMLGSGFCLFSLDAGLPISIGQSDFSLMLDLREKRCIQSFQSSLYCQLESGTVSIHGAKSEISTGVGQADIRAMTYEDGSLFLDQGRLWYTLSIRGRALPHHIQGVFSMSPSVFDIKLEGIIVFDRNDGLLRNEISSHILYDRRDRVWRGLTTGFTAYANPKKEKKQILAIESDQDPRFGFSIMTARPMGMVGDIEDSHILFDTQAQKWRLLTCENHKGYKAVILESDHWDHGYQRIAGPVKENSTGTSIQKLGDTRYCFSGSSARDIFVYSYPELNKLGTLKMDLPPWNEKSGTRVWPNVVSLPEGSATKYIALMMDRYNYPGFKGPHWSYGALYLYYGYDSGVSLPSGSPR